MISKVREGNFKNGSFEGMKDLEIWNRFKNGDWGAYEHIYRSYTKVLFNYGMKIHANSSLVEDAIQELFVELWNSRTNLSPTDKIKFYLLKSLKWKIIYHLKRERKIYGEQLPEDMVEVEVVLPVESILLSNQLTEERKKYLLKALNKLPQRQKEILQLLFFDELSHKEVAELMNIRVRTVYVTAYRALTTLKEKLKPYAIKFLVYWAIFIILLTEIQFF